jgi:hypothetical protein
MFENLTPYISNFKVIILNSDPNNVPSGLLDWVSCNRTLIVFNTYSEGSFAKMFNLKIRADQSLYKESWGSGSIIYVNLFSVKGINNFSKILDTEVFDTENCYRMETVYPGDGLFNMTVGKVQLKGNVSFSTNLLKAVNIKALNSTPNVFDETVVYGDITLTLQNTNISILPANGSFLLKSDGLLDGQITVSNAKNNSILRCYSGNNSFTIDTHKVFTIRASEFEIMLPASNMTGEIQFESLFVHKSPYIPLGSIFEKNTFEGNLSFTTTCISDPLTFFSVFSFNAKVSD